MNNIQSISPHFIPYYVDDLWATPEFQSPKEPLARFLTQLKDKLIKGGAIYFYDYSCEKSRYHLTSIFRFIGRRSYANKYIQDLYYLHELMHCAHYHADPSLPYKEWSSKLSENELISSLLSEAYVYLLDNSLMDKTFKELWIREVLGSKEVNTSFCLESVDLFNPASTQNPELIKHIYNQRISLRQLTDSNSDSLTEAQRIIVAYNEPRQKWLQNWKPYFQKIDGDLLCLRNNDLTTEEYLTNVLSSTDQHGRPYFPAQLFKH